MADGWNEDQGVIAMEQERDMRQANSSRQQITLMLVATIEQIENTYIMGGIDSEEYGNQLKEVDAKLAIVGLSLSVRPWGKPASNRV